MLHVGTNILTNRSKVTMMEVTKIWLTPTEIWVQTADGRQACERFADYAALRDATPAEREQYTLSPYGIHWEHLDEDLCYEGFFQPKTTRVA